MTGLGLERRRMARGILIATIALDAMLAALILMAPSSMGGDFPPFPEPHGNSLGTIMLAVGGGLHLVGLAWMVRIVRADPEGGRSNWRAFRRH